MAGMEKTPERNRPNILVMGGRRGGKEGGGEGKGVGEGEGGGEGLMEKKIAVGEGLRINSVENRAGSKSLGCKNVNEHNNDCIIFIE